MKWRVEFLANGCWCETYNGPLKGAEWELLDLLKSGKQVRWTPPRGRIVFY